MAWSKDITSDPPKFIYKPVGHEHPGITRLIYDPSAPKSRRYIVELSGITEKNQSVAEVESALGIL